MDGLTICLAENAGEVAIWGESSCVNFRIFLSERHLKNIQEDLLRKHLHVRSSKEDLPVQIDSDVSSTQIDMETMMRHPRRK